MARSSDHVIAEENSSSALLHSTTLTIEGCQSMMHQLSISFILASLLYAIGIFANEDPSDVSSLIKEAARANNESLLWGPYKPNLYFGVRPRIANSLAAGLMWAKVDDYETAQASTYIPS